MNGPTLYEALIQPLRLLDEQEGWLLQRLLERPQFHVDGTRERIRGLELTDDPATCPAPLLQYLKDHVGFGSELGAVFSALDETSLRKLIQMAIPFWRESGTAGGVVSMGRSLSGRDPVYEDWFDQRMTVGGTLLGESGVGGSSTAQGDGAEYCSDLRVMDDGALNEALLLELVKLIRPAGERIEIALLDFLDRFDRGLDRWQPAEGSAAGSIVDGALAVEPGSRLLPLVTSVTPMQMESVQVSCSAKLQDVDSVASIRWYDTSRMQVFVGGYYRLLLSCTSPQLQIRCFDGSSHVLFAGDLVGGATIVPGVFYRVRVDVTNFGLYPFIRVHLDDILQYESSDGGEPFPTIRSGDCVFGAQPAGVLPVLFDNVEIWRSPRRWAVVGPAGVTVSPSYFG